jgi:MOSC domain-containing protein YiiM
MTGVIHQLSTSPGGVPKTPVAEAFVSTEGLVGDWQNDRRHHGGPERALCLFSLERIEEIKAEGHPIFPGSTGENLTLSGIAWERLVPGVRLALGDDALIEIASYTAPCKTIRASFHDGDFTRLSQKLNPGYSRLYARVVQEGYVASGDAVRILA